MRKASDIKIPEIILREESDESRSDEVCDLETNIQTKQKKKSDAAENKAQETTDFPVS